MSVTVSGKKNGLEVYAGFFTYRIAHLSAKLNAHASRLLRDEPISGVVHWRILALVHLSEPVNSASLVKAVTMDAGQFSRNLKQMVKAGLIDSRTDSKDNRRQILSLSPKGRTRYERIAPIMKKRRDEMIKGVSKEDREAFFRVLDHLDRRLGEQESTRLENA